MPFSRGSSWPRNRTQVSCGCCVKGRFFTTGPVHTAILKWTTTRTYCIAHETLLNVMWQSGWEGSLGENGYMYIYGWVPSLFTWNSHNIVSWLKLQYKIKIKKQTNKQTKITQEFSNPMIKSKSLRQPYKAHHGLALPLTSSLTTHTSFPSPPENLNLYFLHVLCSRTSVPVHTLFFPPVMPSSKHPSFIYSLLHEAFLELPFLCSKGQRSEASKLTPTLGLLSFGLRIAMFMPPPCSVPREEYIV